MKTAEMVDLVRDYLDSEDWKYEFDAEAGLIRMGINLTSRLKHCKIIIDFRDDDYLVYAIPDINADTENLQEIILFMTMANFGLVNGNFELDVSDGEIRFKTFVNCEGQTSLSKEVIENSINIAAFMLDHYGNGLATLALGFSDGKTEYKKIREADEARRKEAE